MKLGEWNTLRIDRIKEVGAYLTDGKNLESGARSDEMVTDVLLPTRQIPEGAEIGDYVKVFLYRDSEDRPIATTHEPLIELGQIRKLKVKSVSDIGAFLDWGLSRDLFLPFKEQTVKVQQEKSYLVKLYVDKTGRLAASMKIAGNLGKDDSIEKGGHVKGIVYNVKKDFGAFVAVESPEEEGKFTCSGLIHSNEIFENIYVGDEVNCRVVTVRPDGKLDLAMRDEIPVQRLKDAEMVYDIIKSYGGRVNFNDKADAELIKKEFGISKNAFKRAVGALLKEGRVTIDDGITIIG